MGVDDRLLRMVETEKRATDAANRAEAALLQGGRGDGTSGGMEQRVSRLERNVDQITKDMGDVRVAISTITENVRHLPTKSFAFTTVATLLLVSVAVIGLLIRFLPHAPN